MKRFIFLVVLFTFLFTLTCLTHSDASFSPISRTDAENYLEDFLRVFSSKMAQQFGSNSTMYNQYINYEVYVTISTVHGVGVELFPSNKTQFHFNTVDVRIETAVFPSLGFNATLPPINASVLTWGGEPNGTMIMVGDATNTRLVSLVFITNNGHFIELGENGEVYLFDITVDGRYYHAMILRGGNSLGYWNQSTAEKDATTFFEQQSLLTYRQAETIKESMAYPIFQTVLSEVLWKDRNALETNYTLPEHDRDIEAVKELASNTYHFPSSYVDKFYEWLDDVTPKPLEMPKQAWYELAPWSWILAGIVGGVCFEAVLFPIRKWWGKRNPSVPLQNVKRPRKEKNEETSTSRKPRKKRAHLLFCF
jgi:hypothetical protein